MLRVPELELEWRFETDDLTALLASPRAAEIRFHLNPRGSAEEAHRLLNSPHLGGVRTLDLTEVPADAELAAVLARAPGLRHLEVLKLGAPGSRDGPRIEEAGLRALATSPHLTRLRELELFNSRITAEGERALAASRVFANLTRWNLYGNPIGDEGALALAGSAHKAGSFTST
ncbi:MAG TPA: hypothetical protein VGE74_32635 [Gemmata sp.]